MRKQFPGIVGAAVTALLVATALGLVVAAQSGQNAHGIPTPEKVYGDGKTWPIRIETREYDKQRLLSSTLSEDAQTGRVLWLQKCAFCHDGVGQPTYKTMGPWLGAETLQRFGEDTVRQFILNGDVRMPAFRYQLDARQMDDLVAFLKTVPADQKPTPAQLAGRATTGGSD